MEIQLVAQKRWKKMEKRNLLEHRNRNVKMHGRLQIIYYIKAWIQMCESFKSRN